MSIDVVAYFVLVASIFVAVPVFLDVRGRWQDSGTGRRIFDCTVLAILVAIPIVTYVGSVASDRDAATTRMQLEHLRSSQLGRHLTYEQRTVLLGAIGAFAGTHATIAADGTAHDAHGLAEDIFGVFDRAGWVLRGRSPARPDVVDVMMAGGVVPEIGIGVENPKQPSPAASAVLRAFERSGFRPQIYAQGVYPPGSLEVLIGPTPVPEQR